MAKNIISLMGQQISHHHSFCRTQKYVHSLSVRLALSLDNKGFHGGIFNQSSFRPYRTGKTEFEDSSKVTCVDREVDGEISEKNVESFNHASEKINVNKVKFESVFNNSEYGQDYDNDSIYSDETDDIEQWQVHKDDGIWTEQIGENIFLDGENVVETENSREPFFQLVSKPITKEYLSIEEVKAILESQMCIDFCCIDVDQKRVGAKYVDHFVVVSGRSTRHLKAMAFSLVLQFKKAVIAKKGGVTAVVEGQDCHDWMVVDIGNIVVHFMLPETREHYQLESLWSLGPDLDPQYQKMLEDEKLLNEALIINEFHEGEDDDELLPTSDEMCNVRVAEDSNEEAEQNNKLGTQKIDLSAASTSWKKRSEDLDSKVSLDPMQNLVKDLKKDLKSNS